MPLREPFEENPMGWQRFMRTMRRFCTDSSIGLSGRPRTLKMFFTTYSSHCLNCFVAMKIVAKSDRGCVRLQLVWL